VSYLIDTNIISEVRKGNTAEVKSTGVAVLNPWR